MENKEVIIESKLDGHIKIGMVLEIIRRGYSIIDYNQIIDNNRSYYDRDIKLTVGGYTEDKNRWSFQKHIYFRDNKQDINIDLAAPILKFDDKDKTDNFSVNITKRFSNTISTNCTLLDSSIHYISDDISYNIKYEEQLNMIDVKKGKIFSIIVNQIGSLNDTYIYFEDIIKISRLAIAKRLDEISFNIDLDSAAKISKYKELFSNMYYIQGKVDYNTIDEFWKRLDILINKKNVKYQTKLYNFSLTTSKRLKISLFDIPICNINATEYTNYASKSKYENNRELAGLFFFLRLLKTGNIFDDLLVALDREILSVS